LNKLNLKGLKNARDISYSDIKENKLLRSENLSKLTKEDVKILKDDYKLKYIIDLRTEKERKQKDIIIPDVEYIHIPMNTYKDPIYKIDKEAKRKAKNGILPNLCEYYRRLVSIEKKDLWTKLFHILLKNDDGAILWHCASGKDRTGVVAAVIEYMLGVNDNDVMDDYLLTNKNLVTPLRYRIAAFIFIVKKTRHEYRKLFTAREEYLRATIDYIKETYGGVDGFLRDVCGINHEEKEFLKKKYLKAY